MGSREGLVRGTLGEERIANSEKRQKRRAPQEAAITNYNLPDADHWRTI